MQAEITQTNVTSTEPTPIPNLPGREAWPALLFAGIVTGAIGVIVLSWPDETLTVLSVLFGIQLVLFGLMRLISSFSAGMISPVMVGLTGVLSMIAGVVVLRNPFETVEVLVTVLGAIWIASGSVAVVAAAFGGEFDHRGLYALSGLLSLAGGIVMVAWPAPTIAVVAWVAGIYLILDGLAIAVMALRMRSYRPG